MTTTSTPPAVTERQAEVAARIAARQGKYPELDNLETIVRTFKAAGTPWDTIARLVSDWAGTAVSGESLRRWYSPKD